MLPCFVPPAQDELLFSWVAHLAKLNCIENKTVFYKTYIDPDCNDWEPLRKTDMRTKISALHSVLGGDLPLSEFFLRTSCYGALAPLLSLEHQIKQLFVPFRRANSVTMLARTPQTLTPELRLCTQCREEDLENLGRWYYHRAHQIPGVLVCPRHGCVLSVYRGTAGHEFDYTADNFFVPSPSSPINILQQIAVFAQELLDLSIDASAEDTKQVIMEKVKELGYYNPEQNYRRLAIELEANGLSGFFHRGVDHFLKRKLMHVSDAPIAQTLVLLYFLFGSAKEYARRIQHLKPTTAISLPPETPLVVVGTPKRNLMELECTACGYQFCATEAGILRGWGCPRCDEKLSSQELFDRIVRIGGKGEYTLLSRFQKMEEEVLMQHSCGREFKIKPRKFIHDGTRCLCEGRCKLSSTLETLRALDSDYDLIALNGAKNLVYIADNASREVLACAHNKLSERPWIENYSNRFPGTHEAFCLRIKGLVGDEYTVVGNFTSYHDKVRLRHNFCGCEQDYYPHNFLYGQRCKHCTPVNTPEFLRVEIPRLSHGEYIFGGMEASDMIRVINIHTHEEITLRPKFALQELSRLTPSRILPSSLPSKDATHSESPEECAQKYAQLKNAEFLQMLQREYRREKFIFLDEFNCDPEAYQTAKHAMDSWAKTTSSTGTKILVRLHRGIYAWPNISYTTEEMITSKYCYRRGKVIGYTYGKSLAYALGLTREVPDKMYFTTAKASQRHGRCLPAINHIAIYSRAPRIPITNENFRVVQLLDLLPNLQQYIDCSYEEALDILREYARRQDITKEDANSYLHLYPDWVPSIVDKILS